MRSEHGSEAFAMSAFVFFEMVLSIFGNWLGMAVSKKSELRFKLVFDAPGVEIVLKPPEPRCEISLLKP